MEEVSYRIHGEVKSGNTIYLSATGRCNETQHPYRRRQPSRSVNCCGKASPTELMNKNSSREDDCSCQAIGVDR